MVKKHEIIEKRKILPGMVIPEEAPFGLELNKIISARTGELYNYTAVDNDLTGVSIIGELENDLVAIREYRAPIDDIILSFPTGALKKREALESAARREFQEETGYVVDKLTPLGGHYLACGLYNLKLFYFTGPVIGAGKQKQDKSEDIGVVRLSFEKMIKMVSSGEIESSNCLAGLLKYAVHKKKL